MTKTSFSTTDAGHRFLELYAEPVVTNTYLKVALLVLSIVTLATLALLYRADTAALRLKPLVISVSDAGRGQVSSYADFYSSRGPIEEIYAERPFEQQYFSSERGLRDTEPSGCSNETAF